MTGAPPTIRCSFAGCRQVALYKLAAYWTDGRISELKTYGFACPDHLGVLFRDCEGRHRLTRCQGSEVVEELGIYRYQAGQRDRQLQRLWGLEANYRTSSKSL